VVWIAGVAAMTRLAATTNNANRASFFFMVLFTGKSSETRYIKPFVFVTIKKL